MRRVLRAQWAVPTVVVAACVTATAARAVFTTTSTSAQTLRSTADFLPPIASASKAVGPNNAIGVVTPGQPFRVYASVADQGNPPSGTKTVTGNLAAIGTASVTLSPGTYLVGGTTYNYATGSLTASSSLTPPLSYSLTMTDNLNQSASQTFTASIACAPSGLTADNGASSNARRVDLGDIITYTFTAPIDPSSILAGWTGSGTRAVQVVLESRPNGDTINIRTADNSRDLPIGEINTHADFAGTSQWLFASVMTYKSSTNQIQIVLGGRTPSSGNPPNVFTRTQFTWTIDPGLLDAKGYQCSTTPFTQPSQVYNF
jgi:hypothetical protein